MSRRPNPEVFCPPRWLLQLLTALLIGFAGLSTNSQVMVWGDNTYGQTNVPASASNVMALAAGDITCLALRTNGSVVVWPGVTSEGIGTRELDVTNAVAVAAGSGHGLVLRRNGTLEMVGKVMPSNVGSTPLEATNIVGLALGSGAQHALVLRADGTVLDWGNSYYGLTNPPPTATHAVEVAAGSRNGVALRADGSVVVWGDNGYNQLNVPASATNIVAIAASWSGLFGLRDDGTMLSWGALVSPPAAYGFANLIDLAGSGGADFSVLAARKDGSMTEYHGSMPAYPANQITAVAAGSWNGLALIGQGPPVFPGRAVNHVVSRGKTAFLRMKAVGAMPISYQWYCNGTNIAGATNLVLVLPNVQPEQQGNAYTLKASNSLGVATSEPIMLYQEPLEVTVQPWALTVLPGTNVTLVAATVGQGPFGYQWRFNGTNLESATAAALVLTNIQLSQSGSYSVVASNGYGYATNIPTAVSVVPLLLTNQLRNQTVAAGSDVTFNVGAAGDQPFGYQWSWGGTNLGGATDALLVLTNVQLAQAGSYAVTVSNLWGPVTNSAVLSVVPLLVSNQPASQTVSLGSNVTFSAAANGLPPFTYQWQWNGTNLTDATNSSLVLTNVQFSQSGLYSVMVSNSYGAVASSNAALSMLAAVISSRPLGQSVLAGDNATLSVAALGQSLSYQWLCNGTNIPNATNASLIFTNIQMGQAGTISVVISNGYGCVTSSPAILSVYPLWIGTQPLPVSAMAGGNATFTVSVSSQKPVRYQWSANGTNILNATNNRLSRTSLKMSQAGGYSVTVTNIFGSAVSSVATLSVTSLWLNAQPQNHTALAGTNPSMNVGVGGEQPFWYQWRFQGTNLPNATNSSLQLTNVQPSQAGSYSVTVSNLFDRVASSNGQVVVMPVLVEAPLKDQVGFRGGSNTLSLVSQSTVPTFYQWAFNGTALDGATTNQLTLTDLQYSQAGTYQLTISNMYGATNSSALLAVVPIAAWGSPDQTSVPAIATNVLAVACGDSFDLALLADRTVLGWGDNSYGQITIPTNLQDVVAVSAGQFHSLALLADGHVAAWGRNDSGQADVPTDLSNVVAIAGGSVHSLALRSDGTVLAWGNNGSGQTTVPSGLTNAVAIAAGYNHSLALRSDETVLAWGENTAGQTNVPQDLSNVVAVAGGAHYSLALGSDRTLIAWGQDSYGAASVPGGLSNVVAMACGASHNLVLQSDGQVNAWGYGVQGQTTTPFGLTNVIAIDAGYYNSLALVGEPPLIKPLQLTIAVSRNGLMTLQAETHSGKVYALQYKNSLADPYWITMPLSAGNGAVLNFTNPIPANRQRFYRICQW